MDEEFLGRKRGVEPAAEIGARGEHQLMVELREHRGEQRVGRIIPEVHLLHQDVGRKNRLVRKISEGVAEQMNRQRIPGVGAEKRQRPLQILSKRQ